MLTQGASKGAGEPAARNEVWGPCWGLASLISETSPHGWGLEALLGDKGGLWRPPGVGSRLLNIIYSFAIGVFCLARASVLCQAAAGGSWVQLAPVESLSPQLPRQMIPVQGHARQAGTALLFVLVPRVLLQRRSLSWVTRGMQCQVIAPHRLPLFSTTFLQPNSCYRHFLLLQNPFFSPVP